ncbi:hypothetical protein CANARDRAFT_25316 [[Candida] arabinofermentans NRRL YB-2248]|uniref:PA14 domain-containing protein n=1 Tax=[Candida] arabinofermentans NRRL YB-2248 TaxID=983967 RepID=A0A1E4SU60_9ASCO|nr:hypothetical protein CANARDRAFT_25316 [[Candida] arabinofermentans NRRL YB-2248]
MNFKSFSLLLATLLFNVATTNGIIIFGESNSFNELQGCSGFSSSLTAGITVKAFNYALLDQALFNFENVYYTDYAYNLLLGSSTASTTGFATGFDYTFRTTALFEPASTSAFDMKFDYQDTVLEFTGYFNAPTSGLYLFKIPSVNQGAVVYMGSSSLMGCCSSPDYSDSTLTGEYDYLMAVITTGAELTSASVLVWLDEGYYPIRAVTTNNFGDAVFALNVIAPDQTEYEDAGDYMYVLPSGDSCGTTTTMSNDDTYTLSTWSSSTGSLSCASYSTTTTSTSVYSYAVTETDTTSNYVLLRLSWSSSTYTTTYETTTTSTSKYLTYNHRDCTSYVPAPTYTVTTSWSGSTTVTGSSSYDITSTTVSGSAFTNSYWLVTVSTPWPTITVSSTWTGVGSSTASPSTSTVTSTLSYTVNSSGTTQSSLTTFTEWCC